MLHIWTGRLVKAGKCAERAKRMEESERKGRTRKVSRGKVRARRQGREILNGIIMNAVTVNFH